MSEAERQLSGSEQFYAHHGGDGLTWCVHRRNLPVHPEITLHDAVLLLAGLCVRQGRSSKQSSHARHVGAPVSASTSRLNLTHALISATIEFILRVLRGTLFLLWQLDFNLLLAAAVLHYDHAAFP